MKKILGLVFIIVGTVVSADMALGMLAGGTAAQTSRGISPAAALLPFVVIVLVGIRWRKE
jgi:hypothetical protein